MENEIKLDDAETPAIEAGDVEKAPDTTDGETEEGEGIKVSEGGEVGDTGEGGETGEHVEGEHLEGEHVEGEHIEGEHVEGEHVEGEHIEGEHIEGEHIEGEQAEGKELMGEQLEGEQVEGEAEEAPAEEEVMEEEFVPEPPPDPAAPYNFSDSSEAMKAPFQLRPDQITEIEQLWELYQDYNPAYSDLDGFITEKELVYLLKCLLIMTYTEEQFQELIAYCCRPPHEKGHISYDQFLKMVKIRQRDFPIEEEIRAALQVYDPERSGSLDRDNLRETLQKVGHKLPTRLVDNLIKEVDMSNDGTIGIEDIVGTMCIDLNPEDLELLRKSVYPKDEVEGPEMELGDDV